MSLIPCVGCSRHIQETEAHCPFCAHETPENFSARRAKGTSERLSRAAIFAFGASLAACGGSASEAGTESADATAAKRMSCSADNAAHVDLKVNKKSITITVDGEKKNAKKRKDGTYNFKNFLSDDPDAKLTLEVDPEILDGKDGSATFTYEQAFGSADVVTYACTAGTDPGTDCEDTDTGGIQPMYGLPPQGVDGTADEDQGGMVALYGLPPPPVVSPLRALCTADDPNFCAAALCGPGTFCDEANDTCAACAIPECAAPPIGCHYVGPAATNDQGCPVGCGSLVCDDDGGGIQPMYGIPPQDN